MVLIVGVVQRWNTSFVDFTANQLDLLNDRGEPRGRIEGSAGASLNEAPKGRNFPAIFWRPFLADLHSPFCCDPDFTPTYKVLYYQRVPLRYVRRPSVCRLTVTFARPTQAIKIFGNISTLFGTMAIHWHPDKILRRWSQGEPLRRRVKRKRIAEYSDFGPIEGYPRNGARYDVSYY